MSNNQQAGFKLSKVRQDFINDFNIKNLDDSYDDYSRFFAFFMAGVLRENPNFKLDEIGAKLLRERFNNARRSIDAS